MIQVIDSVQVKYETMPKANPKPAQRPCLKDVAAPGHDYRAMDIMANAVFATKYEVACAYPVSAKGIKHVALTDELCINLRTSGVTSTSKDTLVECNFDNYSSH